jgi:hypothetical protein
MYIYAACPFLRIFISASQIHLAARACWRLGGPMMVGILIKQICIFIVVLCVLCVFGKKEREREKQQKKTIKTKTKKKRY